LIGDASLFSAPLPPGVEIDTWYTKWRNAGSAVDKNSCEEARASNFSPLYAVKTGKNKYHC